jgi:hypothetical protein
LLHLALGCANLLARLADLLARFLRLRALLAVLLDLGAQVLAVLNLLLLKVPEALAELNQILSLETILILGLEAILVLSLKPILVPRLVWLLGGQGQQRAGRE